MLSTKSAVDINYMYWIGSFIVIVFIIPNTTNFKERKAFSDKVRLANAMAVYRVGQTGDSVTLAAGPYYDRNAVSQLFLGEKQRELWITPIQVKVFDYNTVAGGLRPVEFGGGQQTISIELEDKQGKSWALRSVNKDQKSVLSPFLQTTFLRFMVRDQLASASPYGQLVVPVFASRLGLFHATPRLYLVPYDETLKEYNERMAGRMAFLEEDIGGSWKGTETFGGADDIINSDEMMELLKKENTKVDSMLYLKTRLFDMLLSDWDRHPGNWRWAVFKQNGQTIIKPIAKDRDNVFYQFDEGLLSRIALLFAPKFQSFRKDFGKVSGLIFQSKPLDVSILSNVEKNAFEKTALEIQGELDDQLIKQAFKRYPPEIYKKAGKQHEEIFKARLNQLPEVAKEFFELIHQK